MQDQTIVLNIMNDAFGSILVIRGVAVRSLFAIGRNRPSLCEKSDHNETVGKLCTFPLRLTVKQDEEWDGASKSGALVNIFSHRQHDTRLFTHPRPLADLRKIGVRCRS
jgi:hypothetical protein